MVSFAPPTCERCSALVESRSRIVDGVGPTDASIVIVGEAPGENEDKNGEPFVGRSGDVLTSALNAHGITRGDVRITNTVRCRPPDNRDPKQVERDACWEYLVDEITTINPDVIVAVGRIPVTVLVDEDVSVTNAAGEIRTTTVGETQYDVLVSVHPAATMYDHSLESVFDETFKRLAERTGYSPSSQTQVNDF